MKTWLHARPCSSRRAVAARTASLSSRAPRTAARIRLPRIRSARHCCEFQSHWRRATTPVPGVCCWDNLLKYVSFAAKAVTRVDRLELYRRDWREPRARKQPDQSIHSAESFGVMPTPWHLGPTWSEARHCAAPGIRQQYLGP